MNMNVNRIKTAPPIILTLIIFIIFVIFLKSYRSNMQQERRELLKAKVAGKVATTVAFLQDQRNTIESIAPLFQ